MPDARLRRQIAFLAAQLMYQRSESEYFTAKRKAARQLGVEFLLAALLHDVGKAIDPADHVTAALQALEGAVTARTAGLIAHHMDAQAYRDGTLGARARVRLQQLEDVDDLMLFCACDRRGRVPGAIVDELPAVLEFLRRLSDELDAEA